MQNKLADKLLKIMVTVIFVCGLIAKYIMHNFILEKVSFYVVVTGLLVLILKDGFYKKGK